MLCECKDAVGESSALLERLSFRAELTVAVQRMLRRRGALRTRTRRVIRPAMHHDPVSASPSRPAEVSQINEGAHGDSGGIRVVFVRPADMMQGDGEAQEGVGLAIGEQESPRRWARHGSKLGKVDVEIAEAGLLDLASLVVKGRLDRDPQRAAPKLAGPGDGDRDGAAYAPVVPIDGMLLERLPVGHPVRLGLRRATGRPGCGCRGGAVGAGDVMELLGIAMHPIVVAVWRPSASVMRRQ